LVLLYTAIPFPGRIIRQPKAIAQRYMKSWFVVDLVSSMCMQGDPIPVVHRVPLCPQNPHRLAAALSLAIGMVLQVYPSMRCTAGRPSGWCLC
jgi:hypothetical protein